MFSCAIKRVLCWQSGHLYKILEVHLFGGAVPRLLPVATHWVAQDFHLPQKCISSKYSFFKYLRNPAE